MSQLLTSKVRLSTLNQLRMSFFFSGRKNFLVFILQDDIRHGGMLHTFVQNVSSYSASIQVTPDESSDPESPAANKVCSSNLLDLKFLIFQCAD